MNNGSLRPESLIGHVVADYVLTAYIGTGATGLVYRARRTPSAPSLLERSNMAALEFPEDAAVKLLVPPLGASQDELDEFQGRFLREARTLKQLSHPHILSLIDYGEDENTGYFYMLLRYMAGGSLGNIITERGQLPLTGAARILEEVAEALDYAHDQGVIHRDVKPGNILLDADGAAHLSDFSIVRLLSDTATQRTTTGRMMGTPAYMAPEQFDDSSKVGPAADLYGLGMVAYAMVTGQAAFSATSWAQVMKLQLLEVPALPHSTRPDLPEPAEAAILRALEKSPEKRFPSATAFAHAFTKGLEGQWADGLTRFVAPVDRPAASDPIAQTVPDKPGVQQDRDVRRRTQVGVLGGAVALLLLVACVAGVIFTPNSALFAMLKQQTHSTSTTVQGGSTQGQMAGSSNSTASSHPGKGSDTSGGTKGTNGGGTSTILITSGGNGLGSATTVTSATVTLTGSTSTNGPSAAPPATATPGPSTTIFGDGSNGSLTISSNTTYTPLDATCSGTRGSLSLNFANASGTFAFLAGKPILIHQTQGGAAGTWMQNVVANSPGTTSGTLTLQSPLNATYSTGAQVIVLPEYTNVTVDGGATWSARPWNGSTGGILAFLADGVVTIYGTISASGSGYRAGLGGYAVGAVTGGWGEDQTRTYYDSRNNNDATNNLGAGVGGGGGAGNTGGWGGNHGGGGGGGYSTAGGMGIGSNVAGGATFGSTDLTAAMIFGGGGGGGGASPGNPGFGGGNGGAGGGIIAISAVTVHISGSIIANGLDGSAYVSGDNSGGGGGGAGGSVLLTVHNNGLTGSAILASGGAGGAGGAQGGPARYGGSGGSGRVLVLSR